MGKLSVDFPIYIYIYTPSGKPTICELEDPPCLMGKSNI